MAAHSVRLLLDVNRVGRFSGVSPNSVLLIAGVWVGDAFSRTQRGGVGSDRAVDAAGRGAVSSVAVTIARWLRRSFSVIAPGWRGVIFASGWARGRCSGPTVPP